MHRYSICCQSLYNFSRWGNRLPESEGHGIEASLNLAEESARGLHLQAILFTGVPLINGGPQTSISGLKVDQRVLISYSRIILFGPLQVINKQSREDTDLPFSGANQDVHSVNFMYLKLGLLVVLPGKVCQQQPVKTDEQQFQFILKAIILSNRGKNATKNKKKHIQSKYAQVTLDNPQISL